ncbi:DUF3619 family protein [Amantichitinum ursilacus]|uniref:DUF3619 family protein n=1 Tax=Amantichitinum ursilacus TaxID=857265 RepID=A0A0N0XFV2_9NEIS|nr:DUF3619 family protein [Amantichitinum ursilacus]KPC49399.1 hypothetical protein WG78_20930 [Amantichitinum ursilacus]
MERPSGTEHEFGQKVASVLDNSPLSAHAQTRLAQARQAAVAHAAARQRRPVLVNRMAGLSGWMADHWHAHPAAWSAGVAFALALTVGGWWHLQAGVTPDHALDVQLLADEAPLDTFTDVRFEQWQTAPDTLRD